jgi:hypothetical protein
MTNVLVYDMLDNYCMESEMNDRIKEFKESARPEIDWAARYHVELNNGEKEKWMNEWFEKFAELIVRECYDHCKDQLMDKSLAEEAGLDYNDGVMDCAIGLKQHFGVEE